MFPFVRRSLKKREIKICLLYEINENSLAIVIAERHTKKNVICRPFVKHVVVRNAQIMAMHVSRNIFGAGYVLGRRCNAEQNCVWLQEEEALLNEMEVTGQAFEDMQEQNSRLIQQLREKDDANFKLMTERIKSNQLHKLAREEKDVLKEQVITLTTQVEAANVVVRKLEEKERLLQNSLATVEKELALRQQAMEMHKRKAIESAQSAADLKLHLGKRLKSLMEF